MAEIYEVQYSYQSPGKTYRVHHHQWVLADSLIEAATAVLIQDDAHPAGDTRVHQVILRGRDVITYATPEKGLVAEQLDQIDVAALQGRLEAVRNLARRWDGDKTGVVAKQDAATAILAVLGDD